MDSIMVMFGTLLGLQVAHFGLTLIIGWRLFDLERRVDRMERRLDERINALAVRVETIVAILERNGGK